MLKAKGIRLDNNSDLIGENIDVPKEKPKKKTQLKAEKAQLKAEKADFQREVGVDIYVPIKRCQELPFHQIHLHVREAGEAAFRNDTEVRPASVVHAVIVVDLMREHQRS
ncbi:hypothetical protein PTT_16696 [Pyrenophora teres f. teres 0-1]|uniref:Uncharacterized protein n=1 Tax=Pyrenophora teres f. teres (strain 0-1) TaxID=861557 RepID=E3S2U6_PYRTT|nr:hypothetical protein PTT_16696 [Pyrenophora teres f. teres 0-1]